MDPMTMMMLASTVMKGINGAKEAKRTGGRPLGGFVSGALDGATSGGTGPFSSMFGKSAGSGFGDGGMGIQMPRTDFSRFSSLSPYL